MNSPNQTLSGLTFKQLSSLSTLTYSKTPSPQLITQQNTKINLSRFKSINITDKVKSKITFKEKTQRKRNQSLGNVLLKDPVIHQTLCNTSRENSFDKINFLNVNLQQLQKRKTNKFFSKLTSPSRSINSSPKLLDLSLPVIDTKKVKKNSANKANFMQLWLDEALDPQQLNFELLKQIQSQLPEQGKEFKVDESNNKSVGWSNLSTVRQYKIDRQYLRSQNVPQQVIDRLYSTLYIYTYGIDKVFGEILSVVKNQQQPVVCESKEGQRQRRQNRLSYDSNNKLLDIFWKSYIKLLQGCTSFQTVFQKVQQQHVMKINHLKESIIKRQQEFEQQRIEMNQKISKLQKQILQMQNKYRKLQSQHKILESTLQLTDDAFNEQVQLRLKFQQKINHIYSSYEQLKAKYSSTVQQLNIKIQTQVNNKYKYLSQKQQIGKLQSQLQQTKHFLQQQKQKVKQRQQQITIKRQQLKDLQQQFQHKLSIQKDEQDNINYQINQNKLLSTKYQQLNQKYQLNQYKYQLSQQKLKQLSSIIQNKTRQYDQIQTKYTSTIKKLAQYQHYKTIYQSQINTLQSQLTLNKQKLILIEQQKISLQNKLQLTITQLQQKNYLIQTKSQAMQKIINTIEDLKAIKNKHQRLFQIINSQKTQIQQQKNKILSKYQLQKQQIIGLKMLQQNRQKHIKQIQTKHDKQKDILKRKITAFNQIVTKKESLILHYQKNQQDKNNQILNLNYRIQNIEKQLNQNNNTMQKTQKEKQFIKQRLQDAKQQILRLNEEMKQQGQKLGQKLKLLDIKQEQLQTLKDLMQIVKQQSNFSIKNLTGLYNEYKRIINRKGQYIHPMLYEDLTEQFNRIKIYTVPKLQRMIDQGKQKQTKLIDEIKQKENIIENKNKQVSKLNYLRQTQQQQINKQIIRSKQLQYQIINLNNTINQNIQQIKQYKQQIKQLTTTISTNQSLIQQLTSQIQQKNQHIYKLQRQLQSKQIQTQKLNHNITILSDKLITAENQINIKHKNHIYLNQIQQLQIKIHSLTHQLNNYINKSLQQKYIQTQPQGQVIIERKDNNNNAYSRKNKFINQSQPKTTQKQTQVSLPPYDNIPLYIDNKITQLRNQSIQILSNPNINKTIDIISKNKQLTQKKQSLQQMRSNSLMKEKSLQKQELPKEQLTRRQQLRRALRFTYMRR